MISIFHKRLQQTLKAAVPSLQPRYAIGILLAIGALASSVAYADPASNALPTGGQITSGSGSISQSGNSMTINQNSDKMIANWNSFNIGKDSSVQFVQPGAGSVALNRISGGVSQIFGVLKSNGQVYLINPNGIVFGRSAQVDVGGLVASSLDQSDADFLAGKHTFSGNGTGAVSNMGTITVPAGGVVALIAPQVSNEGTINAVKGGVALAAGQSVTLDFVGDHLISVAVDKAAFDAQVENKGVVIADGGIAIMTAKSANALLNTVVNNDGLIQADTMNDKAGRIVLDGNDTGSVDVGGTLQANGTTLGAGEKGGAIVVTGNQLNIKDNAIIDASGRAGGGTINIGGGKQGLDPTIRNAKGATVADTAKISANALNQGKGGSVVVWSDGLTHVGGTIQARGGVNGGNGGFVETSGHDLDVAAGLRVQTGAPKGKGGLWLLDPTYSVIDSEAAGDIEASLSEGDVVNSSSGTTTISSDIISSSGNNLSFWSANEIFVGAYTISTNGGNLYFGGSTGGSSYATAASNGTTGVKFSGSTINAGSGTVTVNGRGYTPSNRSGTGSNLSSNLDAGMGVEFTGTVSITGSTVAITGQGGHGQNVINTSNTSNIVSCSGDFSCASQPGQQSEGAEGGDGNTGVYVAFGSAVTITATTSATITADGGSGGDASFINSGTGGSHSDGGSGALGYYQDGSLTFNTPTAEINASRGSRGDGSGSGWWSTYADSETDFDSLVCDPGCHYTHTFTGNKLQFNSDNNDGGDGSYGIYVNGALSNTNGAGSVFKLISYGDAQQQGGTLTASKVLMQSESDDDFIFAENGNKIDMLAATGIDQLRFNDQYTGTQSLHIGTVGGVSGISAEDANIQVQSTGSTGSDPAFIQDSGAPIDVDGNFMLTANTMAFNGASNTVTADNISLRPYLSSQNIVIGATDPSIGDDLYLSTSSIAVFSGTVSEFVIGGDTSTGTITVNSATTFKPGRTTLSTGSANIIATANITSGASGTNALGFRTNNNFDASAIKITAGNVYLMGTGNYKLTNSTNAITGIATSSSIGYLELLNTGNLTVNNSSAYVNSTSASWNNSLFSSVTTNGVASSDRVYMNTTGNMVLNAAVSAQGSYTGSVDYSAANINSQEKAAVVLVAGGTFRNNAGSTGISAATSNRYLVYSSTPSNYTDLSTTNDSFKMYAFKFYNSDASEDDNNGYDNDLGGFGRTMPGSTTGSGYLYTDQPTLTITPLEQSGYYGNTPSLSTVYGTGYTASGYIDNDSSTNNTGTGEFLTDATSASLANTTHDITYTQADVGGLTGIVPKFNSIVLGYSVVNQTADDGYTVTPRPITVTADTGLHSTYGNSIVGLTYTITSGNLVNTGTTGALSGGLATDASATSIAGAHEITQGTLDNANYDISYVSHDYTVDKRDITISADTGQHMIFGASVPTLTYAVTTGNLVNTSGNGALTGALETDATSASAVDTGYTVSQGSLDNANYNISYNDASFAVNQRPITITADASQSMVYGNSVPTLTYTVTTGMLVNTGSNGALSGALETDATSGSAVGTGYTITQGSLDNTNYDITYAGDNFAVTQRPITITADTGQNMIYGNSVPTLTYTVTTGTLVNTGTNGALAGALETDATSGSAVGSGYTISQGSLDNGNYDISYVDHSFTVDQRPITITANSGQSMIYGDSVPTLTYTVSTGTLVNTGTNGALSGALQTNANSTSDVGTGYTITQHTLDNSNYDITYEGDNFAVTQRPITVFANSGQSKIQALADPTFTYTYGYTSNTGKPALVNGQSFTNELTRETGELVGDYNLLLGDLHVADGNGGGNYFITFVPQKFRINPILDTSSFTSVQSGITGTSVNAALASTVAAKSVGPGTGSYSIADSTNTQLVSDTTAHNPPGNPPAGTLPGGTNLTSGGATGGISVGRSGNTVTVTFETPVGGGSTPLPEGVPLFVAGKGEGQNYNIGGGKNSLSATLAGAATSAMPTNTAFIKPPVKASLDLPGGSSTDIFVGISSSGVLVIQVPAGSIDSLDPQTTMLIGLAVAKQNFGADVGGITSVVIMPASEA